MARIFPERPAPVTRTTCSSAPEEGNTMSNGNGVTASLSKAADNMKDTAGNIGSVIASTASGAAATARKTAKKASKAVKKTVTQAKR